MLERSIETQSESFKVHEFQRDPRECKDDSEIAAGSLEVSTGTQKGSFKVHEFQRDPRGLKDDSGIAAALLVDTQEYQVTIAWTAKREEDRATSARPVPMLEHGASLQSVEM